MGIFTIRAKRYNPGWDFIVHKLQIFVALDCSSELDAKKITNKLDPEYCGIKVGKELFTAVGPKIIDYIHNKG